MTCAGGQVAELEELAHDPARVAAQRAAALAFLDDELQLLGRVDLLVDVFLPSDADQPQRGPGDRVRDADDRIEHD